MYTNTQTDIMTDYHVLIIIFYLYIRDKLKNGNKTDKKKVKKKLDK